ncbi:Hypothetical predicted protein [Paramuricea clavata]|uniref:Uncharacterized protein n=1 Tax=Paramuricea clavata TaxID=317549 RepID=A0A7D9K388_PARCT|nr:Hypothetical predicted protein [Paramuricea clavata]
MINLLWITLSRQRGPCGIGHNYTRAIVVAKAKLDKDQKCKSIVTPRGTLQGRLVHQLHESAGVPLGSCGIPEVKKFQAALPDYQLNVISKGHLNAMIYSGPEADKWKFKKRVYVKNLSFLVEKFVHRPNMTKIKIISDPAEYFDLLSSDQTNVTDENFINDEFIEVHFENVDEFVESNVKTNVVIAAFTTAHARLKVCGVQLEQLNRRVLYFDTDSVIYVSKKGEWEPPTGSYLGELADELDGAHITTFGSGGPKN